MSTNQIPDHLLTEILNGRCVAFVGAGLSWPVVGGWKDLLRQMVSCAGLEDAEAAELTRFVNEECASALDYQAAAEQIERAHGRGASGTGGADRFEELVKAALELGRPGRSRADDTLVQERVRKLAQLPLEVVLTLNMDGSLSGVGTDGGHYANVLRKEYPWWLTHHWDRQPERPVRERVVKLHGDANGTGSRNPVVLTGAAYRRRVYDAAGYANFLRSVFATRTVLYLGFSFTDAYINELRSEVLSLIGPGDDNPRAYAVMADKSVRWRRWFRDVEGIEVLAYLEQTEPPGHVGHFNAHAGFDEWLDVLVQAASPQCRVRGLLAAVDPQRRVVWVDPEWMVHNFQGIEWLEHAGADIAKLDGVTGLDKSLHSDAALIISRFGYREDVGSEALELLAAVSTWDSRPPVIVFAERNEYVAENRLRCLRAGAFEYATEFHELFELIERLFGRQVGGVG